MTWRAMKALARMMVLSMCSMSMENTYTYLPGQTFEITGGATDGVDYTYDAVKHIITLKTAAGGSLTRGARYGQVHLCGQGAEFLLGQVRLHHSGHGWRYRIDRQGYEGGATVGTPDLSLRMRRR